MGCNRVEGRRVGTADIDVNGRVYRDQPVYGYKRYRSVFNPVDREFSRLPKEAVVYYRGRRYPAVKYGNPRNQLPTFDFVVENKIE